MRIQGASLLALAVTCLSGCGGDFSEPTAHEKQAVIGGEASPPERDGVLFIRGGGGFCTASLVAPGLVLTARHCVSDFNRAGQFACSTDGTVDETKTRSPVDAGNLGPTLPAEDFEFSDGQLVTADQLDNPVAAGVRVFAPETDTICRNDVALVQIEPELDLPLLPLRLHEGTYQGEQLLVVGYGTNETSTLDRYEREVKVLGVGESDYYPIAGEANLRTFTVGQSVCPGDSGGPALTDRGAIAGVFSLVNFDCMSTLARNTYTQLAPYASFIEDAFDQAGYEPLLEPPAGEGGAAGAGGEPAASGGSGGSDTATGGSETGGSGGTGGTASGGTGGKTNPPAKDPGSTCYCRAGGTKAPGSPLLWAGLLLGTLLARRPTKKRRSQA